MKIVGVVIICIITFYLSSALCQTVEEQLATQPDFPFKGLIMLLVPAPEDSLLELLQFLTYWVVGTFGAIKIK